MDEHKHARLYRWVRSDQMTSPTMFAEYDKVRNIVFINKFLWDVAPEHEQAKVYRIYDTPFNPER